MVVFQCAYLNGGVRTFPTWPWQWRCWDHAHKDALERDLTPEDLSRVQEALEKHVGAALPLPLVGLSNLTEDDVAKLRKAQGDESEGGVERLPKPPPVTFVSTREMQQFLQQHRELERE
jgi:hypothetical protein